MTTFQKAVKYIALILAILLSVGIISGIAGAIAITLGIIERTPVLDEMKTYNVSTEASYLNVEINSANLEIISSDKFYVESNLKKFSVSEENGRVTIKDKNKFGTVNSKAIVKIYLPSEKVFDKVKITVGACKLTADVISANNVELNLGAGGMEIYHLNAYSSIEIEGGAGKIHIADGSINNIELEMGVGDLELTAKLLGKNEFNLGVGKSTLTMIGTEDDYSVIVEKGLGAIQVKGTEVSSYKTENGINEVEINGGVGKVYIDYKAETSEE